MRTVNTATRLIDSLPEKRLYPGSAAHLGRGIAAILNEAEQSDDSLLHARCFHAAAVLAEELLARIGAFRDWNPPE